VQTCAQFLKVLWDIARNGVCCVKNCVHSGISCGTLCELCRMLCIVWDFVCRIQFCAEFCCELSHSMCVFNF